MNNTNDAVATRTNRSALAVAAITAAIAVVAFLGANTVSAQTTGESIAEKVATRFNLDQTEVQGFFDEVKEEKQAEREAAKAAHLQSKVDDGTITAEQKTMIEEKFAELRASREELKASDATRDEMQSLREEAKAELEQWAETNGISLEDIRPEQGENGMRGGHGHRGHGAKDIAEDEAS